jgi:uncharacterized protein DUF1844
MEETESKTPGVPESGEDAERLPLQAVDLLRWCVSLLASSAWQAMGLLPDQATKKTERKLDDARLVIDATGSLIDHLRPRVDVAERRELDTLLATLRLNFVEQTNKAQSAG